METVNSAKIAYYHLPGLFEFFEFYTVFLPLYHHHREYFYDWCEIGSIYGAPEDCIWGGGRIGAGTENESVVFGLMQKYGISPRLTFSNSILEPKHLADKRCNLLCSALSENKNPCGGVIVHSDLLLYYLLEKYPDLYYISSTTKVLTDFCDFIDELNRKEFLYVVPDFRLNKSFDRLFALQPQQKDKVEFLCNECCDFFCRSRKKCYEAVSNQALGKDYEFKCPSPNLGNGYRFSKAMKNPGFISVSDIQNIYLPKGFSNFKIEGRSLGTALLLEFLLYYMTKPEYQLIVREEIYLENTLDLF